jgi:phosphatidate cytidylyltransferase
MDLSLKNNFIKRLVSSIIILPILFFIIYYGNIFFFSLLIIIAIISFYELKNISFNNLIFIFSLLILVLFLYCSWELRNMQNGFYLTLFVLFICIFTDIGGYIFGKTFKGPKISHISPNKTYSGMIGSFLLPTIVIFLFLTSSSNSEIYDKIIFLYNLNLFLTIFIISLVSQIGDFMISYLKRKSNKKDTGNLIPGHGGLLDRIDGIIFATIFYYLIIKINL